ncbi:MAG: S9 family peptidase, partial [Bdellovibrionales bacterium]
MLAPKAPKKKHVLEKFEKQRMDPYYWLREKDSLDVLKYIEKENQYTKKSLKPVQDLEKQLFKEMHALILKNYDSVPASDGGYKYYHSFVKGKKYPIHKRIHKQTRKEEVILDENQACKGFKYFDVSDIDVSPNGNILAYSVDTQGREFYQVVFKDLTTGKNLKNSLSKVTSEFAWANDNRTLLYTKQDPETLREYQVYSFDIFTGEQKLIYEEKQVEFSVFLFKDLSEKFIFMGSKNSTAREYFYVPADSPHQKIRRFYKKKPKHEYFVLYGSGSFYILTNKDSAFNFKLMQVKASSLKEDDYSPQDWEEVIPHRENVYIESYEVFQDFIALEVRKDGHLGVEIFDRKTEKLYTISFPEEIYSLSLDSNYEYSTDLLRISYESFTQPNTIYDYDIKNKKFHFKKQYSVGKKFKSEDYVSVRKFAKANDGTLIPLSLIYKKDLKISSSTPVVLYGYGAYGLSEDPYFDRSLIPILDRGFIYAVAHIRGGMDLGKKWYESGKLLKKKNSFSDFIKSAEFLIENSYTSSDHLYIMGGSAGGLLVGAVLNERPDLFKGAIASVPFVDVLTTLLDKEIPLTTTDYSEFGNPEDKKYYDYIQGYSPYDNVRKTNYPHLMIDTGYHDSRVQYWEPVKWAAKLRANKRDDNLLLLKVKMGTGHFGETGRFS